MYYLGGTKGTEKKYVYRITKDWVVNQATWLEAKTGEKWDPQSTDYLKQGGAYTLENGTEIPYLEDEGWENFDVTEIVKYFLTNPTQNFGFFCIDDDGPSHTKRYYTSSDTSQQTIRPKLTIDYSSAIAYFPKTGPKSKINLRIIGSTLRFSSPLSTSRAAIRNAKGQTVASFAGVAGSNHELRLDAFSTGIHFLTVSHGGRSETVTFFVMH